MLSPALARMWNDNGLWRIAFQMFKGACGAHITAFWVSLECHAPRCHLSVTHLAHESSPRAQASSRGHTLKFCVLTVSLSLWHQASPPL